jgi:hypothetical protein
MFSISRLPKQIIEIEMVNQNKFNYKYVNNNNCNKISNFNLFLNEQCKDAINLSSFVDELELNFTVLEDIGELGYVEGISKFFINSLLYIDYTKRPIHCINYGTTRELVYIKDDDKWLPYGYIKTKLVDAIKSISYKNIKQIKNWSLVNKDYLQPKYINKDEYTNNEYTDNEYTNNEYINNEYINNDKYMKIIFNSIPGLTKKESEKNYDKIIKNISKTISLPLNN